MDPSAPGAHARASSGRGPLRERLHRDAGDLDARAALAGLHRAAGHADQAGRWALLVPGMATAAEKQAFIDWIVRSGEADRDRLLRLLFVPRTFSAAEVDPAGVLPGFVDQLRRDASTYARASSTSIRGWIADTAVGVAAVVVLGAVVGGAASAAHAVALATGSAVLEWGIWPDSWAGLWTATGVLTLGLAAIVTLWSAAALAAQLPEVITDRRRRARRSPRRDGSRRAGGRG